MSTSFPASPCGALRCGSLSYQTSTATGTRSRQCSTRSPNPICEEIWCLGDLVGYGADPDACVALAHQHCSICLAGNHDLGVRGAIPFEQFSRGAAIAAHWTRDTIMPETLEFLKSLEPQNLDQAVALYHASPRDPIWEYVLSPLQAELCLDVQRQAGVADRSLACRAVLLAGPRRGGHRRNAG